MHIGRSSPHHGQAPAIPEVVDVPEASRMSQEKILQAAAALKKEGALQIVYVSSADKKDQPSIAFKRVGLIDKLRAWFLNSTQKAQMAAQAVTRLKDVLGLKDDNGWLLTNIRKDIESHGMISGERFAKDLIAFKGGLLMEPSYLRGKAHGYRAPTSVQGVGVVNMRPEDISSDYRVVSFESGKSIQLAHAESLSVQYSEEDEIKSQKDSLNDLLNRREVDPTLHTFRLPHSSSNTALWLPPKGSGSKLLTDPEKLIQAIVKEVNYSGSVVISPLPDTGKDTDADDTYKAVFSDENLEKQLRAARVASEDAKKLGGDFRLTFASTDTKLIQRMMKIDEKLKAEEKTVDDASTKRGQDSVFDD